jgi:hypothetical protein
MRGGFDVLAGCARALDNAGNEVDPVPGKVAALAPLRVTIDSVGVPRRDRVERELIAKGKGVGDAWRDHRATHRPQQGGVVPAIARCMQSSFR